MSGKAVFQPRVWKELEVFYSESVTVGGRGPLFISPNMILFEADSSSGSELSHEYAVSDVLIAKPYRGILSLFRKSIRISTKQGKKYVYEIEIDRTNGNDVEITEENVLMINKEVIELINNNR